MKMTWDRIQHWSESNKPVPISLIKTSGTMVCQRSLLDVNSQQLPKGPTVQSLVENLRWKCHVKFSTSHAVWTDAMLFLAKKRTWLQKHMPSWRHWPSCKHKPNFDSKVCNILCPLTLTLRGRWCCCPADFDPVLLSRSTRGIVPVAPFETFRRSLHRWCSLGTLSEHLPSQLQRSGAIWHKLNTPQALWGKIDTLQIMTGYIAVSCRRVRTTEQLYFVCGVHLALATALQHSCTQPGLGFRV